MTREIPPPVVAANQDQSLWRRLEDVVANVPGWSPVEELFSLYHLVLASAGIEGDVLEIGSWCGRSAIALGWACQQLGSGRVIACDLFPERDDWWRNADGSYSFALEIDGRKLGAYQDQTVWAEPFERDIAPLYARANGIFEIFSECIARYGVADAVTPVRGDSIALVQRLPADTSLRVAFVDGDHGYEAICEDVRNIERYLRPGGWIAFDDAFTSYDGVNRAIRDLIIDNAQYECGVQLTRKMFAARRRG